MVEGKLPRRAPEVCCVRSIFQRDGMGWDGMDDWEGRGGGYWLRAGGVECSGDMASTALVVIPTLTIYRVINQPYINMQIRRLDFSFSGSEQ
jgi:hypothetical protein